MFCTPKDGWATYLSQLTVRGKLSRGNYEAQDLTESPMCQLKPREEAAPFKIVH